MKAYERLLKYVKFDTRSSDESGSHPSTPSQFMLARALADELTTLGCADVRISGTCYVYATVPATAGLEQLPALGFIAHMDTSPDFSGENVDPIITENYDGNDLPLSDSGRTLSVKAFPHLTKLKGRTLITTDGKTLLGADDKAGIAEIMTLAELLSDGTPHCTVKIAFTPDEEIGEGADDFDVEGFGAAFAYTVDGGEEGSLEYENFNAASAEFTVNGVNVHPGSAKDVMLNASLVAMEINSMLPENEIPARTEGYEGFFHLTDMRGAVESAKLSYIVRDHDAESFRSRCDLLLDIERKMKAKYGDEAVSLKLREQYRNMKEMVYPAHAHLIENAKAAARAVGIEPSVEPIRGGTDGARLSFMGLPCPNLGTAGYAFHGPYEHVTVEGMDKVTEILLEIVGLYSKK